MSDGGSGSASTSSHRPNVVSVSAWYGSISWSMPTWRAASRFTLDVSVRDASIAMALRPAIGGGEGEEVNVVRVVRERIDALRLLPFDEHLVGVDGVLVGLHGVVPASDADVDVRGHVDHVSFARHELRESLGARHRGLRVHRFDGVDVVVARAGVVRVLGR